MAIVTAVYRCCLELKVKTARDQREVKPDTNANKNANTDRQTVVRQQASPVSCGQTLEHHYPAGNDGLDTQTVAVVVM